MRPPLQVLHGLQALPPLRRAVAQTLLAASLACVRAARLARGLALETHQPRTHPHPHKARAQDRALKKPGPMS